MLSTINKMAMEIESSHSSINLLSKLIPDNKINLTVANASVSSPNSSSRSLSFPPTPPSSRSPPASNFSPSNVKNEQRQPQVVQNSPISFSIANILKPTFGATKSEVNHNDPSERPKSLDIVLRTPPKTPEPAIRQDSPVDLTHKHDLSLLNNATNNSLLSHSINFLLNAQNTTVINPLQHHIHQQLLQQQAAQQAAQHLPHPVITKPIPLSTTTAFQLFKPLGSIAAEHQRRLQHHQQHQQLQLQLEQQRQNILKSQQIQSLNQHRLQKSSLELQQSRKDESRSTETHHPSPIPISAPSPTPSSCSTSSSTSTSSTNMSISSSDPNKLKEPSTETIEELVNPKVPDDNSNWPAWVYCTRYSDRPSSGPRSRRIKRSNRTPDEKRPRTAFTTDQLGRLKKEFDENRYLTEKRRQDLARELGLNESQIKIWFQNKRAKIKKSSGPRGGLAQHLMAQGLYNHCTVPVDEDDPYLN